MDAAIETTKRRYEHKDKVGNAGDVWKHFILLQAASALGKISTYFETHAGKHTYTLVGGGEWESGIGTALKAIENYSELQETHYFSQFKDLSSMPVEYLGSWVMMQKYLPQPPDVMLLHDTNPDCLVHECTRPNVEVTYRVEDGFSALETWLSTIDTTTLPSTSNNLLLIDPPYTSESDWDRVTEACLALDAYACISYLVWYPIRNGDENQRRIELLKTENSNIPISNARKRRFLEVRNKMNNKGCGIIVGGTVRGLLDPVLLKRLALAMEWDYREY